MTALLTILAILQHTARFLPESVADRDCLVRNSGYMTHITSHSFVKMTEQSWSQSSVTDTGIFSSGELVGINRYRHFKKAHSSGNLVQCGGITVDPIMYLNKKGETSQEFWAQRSPSLDHRFWLCAIGSLTVLVHKLLHPLGKYITDQTPTCRIFGSQARTVLKYYIGCWIPEVTKFVSVRCYAGEPGSGQSICSRTLSAGDAHIGESR